MARRALGLTRTHLRARQLLRIIGFLAENVGAGLDSLDDARDFVSMLDLIDGERMLLDVALESAESLCALNRLFGQRRAKGIGGRN